MKKLKIFIISGSTKKNSSNKIILNYFVNKYSHVEFDFFEGVDKLPHFNPDLDHTHPPKAVHDFRKRIDQANGVIICTPEYVFNLPGSLKNVLDWMVSTTILTNKPVAQIVASASGQQAFQSLHLILSTLQANVSENTRLLIQGVKGKISHNNDIEMNTSKELEKLFDALVEVINAT